MSDALFFGFMGILAAAMIALALNWPQGLGARSPDPFGHATAAEMRAAAEAKAAQELKGAL